MRELSDVPAAIHSPNRLARYGTCMGCKHNAGSNPAWETKIYLGVAQSGINITMKHKHHIIPKHMGGDDNPNNLIELSIEEHANAHKKLYELYGHYEDKIAWLGLSGRIGKEEILLERSRLGGKANKGTPKTKEHKEKIRAANKENPRKGGVKEHTSKTKLRISELMKKNTNSANHSSIEYREKQSIAMKKAWAKRKAKIG